MIVAAAAALVSGCLPWRVAVPGGAYQSAGTVSNGALVEPEHMEKSGDGFRSYKVVDRRFGTRELVGLVRRASGKVAARHPGSVVLVGDMSARRGGKISGHRSHRSGRDVDFAFFVTSAHGAGAHGWPLIRFDRFGVGLGEDDRVRRFDLARNWALVEGLLADGETDVQWIFVSDGLKARLMKWAIDHGRDVELIERAATVLHQPSDSAPHDDHFHVRVYCPEGERGGLCVDTGPVWEWVRERRARREDPGDDRLLDLALEGLDG